MFRNELYRIIDANINRTSEALRVLEDWVRFGKNNSLISEKLKSIRHTIGILFSNYLNLILYRDSVQDVGKNIENTSSRNSVKDIIRANCKRLEESLRSLSEYGQLVGVDVAKIEEYRYEIYTIEKELVINEKLIRLNNARLYLVASRDAPTGRLYEDNEFLSILEEAIQGGIDIIQLRKKNENEKKILELAKEIKKIILNTDVLFIVNDRIDLALACDADGVHLGQDDMPIYEARKITPDGFIIGLSTHNIEQGEKGLKSHTDYIGVGPVFQTPTKPDYLPAGLEYVEWASKNIKDIPFFAIGGIDETNIDKVVSAGAKRIAVVRAIMNAKDPLKITQMFVEALRATPLQGNKNIYAQIR